jgi:hypothetical protein
MEDASTGEQDANIEAEPDDSGSTSADEGTGSPESEPPGAEPTSDLLDGGGADLKIAPADGSDARVLNPGDYAGTWTGTTSQDRTVRFVGDALGIYEFEYGWVLPQCASSTKATFGAPVPIVDGRVERTIAGMPSAVIVIEFESASRASGSLDFTLRAVPNVPGCTGQGNATFVATKQ